MNKKQYKDLLNDLVSDQCNKDYCIFKELLVHMHTSERMLMQMKCIEKLKYERSKIAGHDIGWTEAVNIWVEDGYAKIFADVYSEEKKYTQIYKEVMGK